MSRTVTVLRWVARCALVAAAVGLLSFACYRLGINLATMVCLDIILIVLLSLRGDFPLSAFASVFAVGCLDYYFLPPLFSLEVSNPLDVLAIVLFVGTSAVITTLVTRERARTRQLAVTVAKLEEQIAERRRTQEVLQQAQQFARVNRLMLMGEMTASIAHEVNQPLTGIIANAGTCQRYLGAAVPDLAEVRMHLDLIARDGRRAADIIGRVRRLVKRAPPRSEPLDLNETLLEALALADRIVREYAVDVRTELAPQLAAVPADRIQLQQVVLNLVVNAAEAMGAVHDRPRELVIASRAGDRDDVVVDVRDTGPGIVAAQADDLFSSFYSTKPEGMGMGLSISRLIIETHGGQLVTLPNVPHGAVFRFTLPLHPARDDD